MNRNPVSAAIELVDNVPSNEFRSTLRAQLLAGFTESATTDATASQHLNTMLPDSDEEYIQLIPNVSRFGPNRHFAKTVLAAAACVAVFTAVAVIVSRAGNLPSANAELHDVNQHEAMQLAQRATIAADPLDQLWQDGSDWARSTLPAEAAATIAALPNCASLTTAGLLPPTSKSAITYQWVDGSDLLMHKVFVFATPEDASRAMDVIAGEHYPTCWFNLFDRDSFHSYGWTSISEAWDAPNIARHGDQQIIIGQHATLLIRFKDRQESYLINAYVRVGRAITFINPRYVDDGGNPLLAVDKAITAATDALTRAVGP